MMQRFPAITQQQPVCCSHSPLLLLSLLLLLLLLLQALALDEEVPDRDELEDDTEPDMDGINRHRAKLVGVEGLAAEVPRVWGWTAAS